MIGSGVLGVFRGCCVTVHIVRLDRGTRLRMTGAPRPRASACQGCIKRPGDVIFPSTHLNTVRARLNASCSLVSLAVQSLRSM
ncbi:hypothetical protein DDQ41_18460 [Streptomyces spongiicola]|uniref:Secreted protein n=1 Tax=Streptomyces spongiicola TaxID=1690221 RepID=A0ABM6VFB1_9ACTN|nr:hypothetical protein DDQ41_18460 [Streptomyces spongiicola]